MDLELQDKLTVRNWESALRRETYLDADGTWLPAVRAEGLTIDLSRVEWVEPAAVVRMVLMIESARLAGISVTLWFPRPSETPEEAEQIANAEQAVHPALRNLGKRIKWGVSRRKEAFRMLVRLELDEVLRRSDLVRGPGKLTIHDWDILDGSQTLYKASGFFRVIFPLRWIGLMEKKDYQLAIDQIASALETTWVASGDVMGLAEIVVQELAENAIMHGKRTYALVTAIQRTVEPELMTDEVLACEQAFFGSFSHEHPLLELLVGDSGRGIPATLAARYHMRNDQQALFWGSEEQQVLAWSFDKWSSQREDTSRIDPRGLYRIARIVRRNSGLVTLRSGQSYVGLDWSRRDVKTTPYVVDRGKLAPIHGTVAHVRIPAKPMALGEGWVSRPALAQAEIRVLHFDHAALKAINGIVERVIAAAKAMPLGHSCLVVDMGFMTLHKAKVAMLLKALAQVANPLSNQVAIVVVNLSDPEVSPDLNADGGFDAILVRQGNGQLELLGAPEDTKKLYQELLENDTMSSEKFRELYPDPAVRDRLLRSLTSLTHLVRADKDGLGLYFNLQDVDWAVAAHVDEEMQKLMADEMLRPVRSPSLELMSKYLPVGRYLDELGIDRTLAALARRFRHTVDLRGRETVEIVADSRMSSAILSSFQKHLMVELGRSITILSHVLSAEDKPTFHPGSMLLLLTDIVVSGDLVGRLIRQAFRASRFPDAVVTIIDGKPGDRTRFQYLTQPIETVIPLSQVDLTLKEPWPAEPVNVSPISMSTETNDLLAPHDSHAGNHPLLDLDRESIKQDALYYGHITQPNGRHFTIYLDAMSLLKGQETAQRIYKLIRREIRVWRRQYGIQEMPLVGYPASDWVSPAEEIARNVCKPDKIIPIRGAAGASHLRFGQQAGFQPDVPVAGKNVVVVDAGARTGESIRQLILAAASAGVKRLMVIVLLDEMEPSQSEFLTQLKQINRPGSESAEAMSVRVRFLGRFPAAVYDSLHCPHCQILHRLADESQHAWGLRGYMERTALRIQPQPLFDESSRAAYRNNKQVREIGAVPPETILGMVRWRQQLIAARGMTTERQRLYENLSGLLVDENKQNERACVVHLLAAEWTWLKMEPLSLHRFKKVLAELAVMVALDPGMGLVERRHALILLRTASKEEFANRLPTLFKYFLTPGGANNGEREDLLMQLLYGAFTFLRRDYQIPNGLKLLLNKLEECPYDLGELGGKPVGEKILQTLIVLKSWARSRSTASTSSPFEAWQKLADTVNKFTHHDSIPKLVGNLYQDLTGDVATLDDAKIWSSRWKGWAPCASSLQTEIIPGLRDAQPIFHSPHAGVWLGTEGREQLRSAASELIHEYIGILEAKLWLFASDPHLMLEPDHWIPYTEAVRWLNNVIAALGSHGRSTTREPNGKKGAGEGSAQSTIDREGSTLVRFARQFKGPLHQIVYDKIGVWEKEHRKMVEEDLEPAAEIDFDIDGLAEDERVCAPAHLVEECINELLTNAVKHNRPAESEHTIPIQVRLRTDAENGTVLLSIRNKGEYSQGPGHNSGRKQLLEWLEGYGADMRTLEKPEEPWSYQVDISFGRWGNA